MTQRNPRSILEILLALGLWGYVAPAFADSSAQHNLAPDVRWFRNSAERQVGYAQAYAEAWRIVHGRLAQGVLGPWAVILDADETIIDNSEFQKRTELGAVIYSDKTWDDWLTEQARRADSSSHEDFVFKPAREFASQVHAAGGKIIVITNRTTAQCTRTETVLKASANKPFAFDAMLCANDAKQGKESRFAAVESGVIPSVGTVDVLLFVGDNIMDCQGQSQQQYDLALFGTRCIMLPNPMYGSWTSNPDR